MNKKRKLGYNLLIFGLVTFFTSLIIVAYKYFGWLGVAVMIGLIAIIFGNAIMDEYKW